MEDLAFEGHNRASVCLPTRLQYQIKRERCRVLTISSRVGWQSYSSTKQQLAGTASSVIQRHAVWNQLPTGHRIFFQASRLFPCRHNKRLSPLVLLLVRLGKAIYCRGKCVKETLLPSTDRELVLIKEAPFLFCLQVSADILGMTSSGNKFQCI